MLLAKHYKYKTARPKMGKLKIILGIVMPIIIILSILIYNSIIYRDGYSEQYEYPNINFQQPITILCLINIDSDYQPEILYNSSIIYNLKAAEPNIGQGYVKKNFYNIKSVEEAKEKCSWGVFKDLMVTFCSENEKSVAFWSINIYEKEDYLLRSIPFLEGGPDSFVEKYKC